MIEIQGQYSSAKVFTDNIDELTISQITELCNQPFTKGATIRIMPDTHVGKGSVIGTTMNIDNKVIPNLVGVDVGCGMSVAKINMQAEGIDFAQLDQVIRKYVPSGFNIRGTAHELAEKIDFDSIIAPVAKERARKSIGSLGGGNHFIEINQGQDGAIYLVIHSGSRNLGKQIAEYYQELAYTELSGKDTDALIEKLKAEGRERDIQSELKKLEPTKISKQLAYLEGESFDNYIHDMKIAQQFATLNRKAMQLEISKQMNWELLDSWQSVHNFIDTDNMILRKGATSAKKGEKLLIPINMRDGSIIAVGKGNADWNFSAPHGAGRLMSRSKARETVKLEDFQQSMKGVWTTSVNKSTIDESPFAYKPMQEIIDNIQDTVEILDVIKPLYNFKAN